MVTIPFALSISHFVSSVGAKAGFAAIIGLAILVLLHFAQARETASLRDRAEESAQRVQQLEGRLAQLTQLLRQPAAPAPAPQPVPAARPLANPIAAATAAGSVAPLRAPLPLAAHVAAAVPAAPAGVGAPALSTATRLIPTPGPVVAAGVGAAAAAAARVLAGAPVAVPGTAPVLAGAPVAVAGTAPVAGTGSPGAVASPPRPPIDPTPIGQPATPAGGGNGAPGAHVPSLADLPPDFVQSRSRVQIRPGGAGGRQPVLPPRRPPLVPPPRSRAGRGFPLLIGALAVVAAVAVLLIVTSLGGGKPASSSSTPTSNAPSAARHRTRPPAFSNASVTAAVLNGTATSGLAHRVGVLLGSSGYKEGTIATATDQTHTATVVAYRPNHKRDALAVASTLKLGSGSVQPIDQNTQATACPPPSACAATVVVTVGSDLASTP